MLIEKVRRTIKKFGLLKKRDKVVIAVSGGPDSTALLLALYGLRDHYSLKMYMAHLDHMFRSAEERKKDYEYVSALSQRLRLPLIFERIDVPRYARQSGLSPEEAARNKRYDFLLKAAEEVGASKIALGHTLDDQAETILMRLIRGTGSAGLRGIPISRNLNGILIIRPLLEIWRKDIEAYLRSLKIEPRQDVTNLMPKFFRNRVRNEVIKFLEKYNPNIKEALARSAQNFAYDYEVLSDVIDKEFKRCAKAKGSSVKIAISALKKRRIGLRRGILRRAIEILKRDLRRIDYLHIERIEDLMERERGALDLPDKVRVKKARDFLILSRIGGEARSAEIICRRIAVPGKTDIAELKLSVETEFVKKGVKSGKPKNVEYIDYDNLKGGLYLRTWQRGDRFKPLGMTTEKKLQDFFVDEKVPKDARGSIPLLISGKKIIWVCGLRLSDDAKMTKKTKKILKLLINRGRSI